MKWQWSDYSDLDDLLSNKISQLRNQSSSIEDSFSDKFDKISIHLLGFKNSRLVAYGRLIPPNDHYVDLYISKIVVDTNFRNMGYGNLLMQQLLSKSKELYPGTLVKLSSLEQTVKFYKKFGFQEDELRVDEKGKKHHIMKNNG